MEPVGGPIIDATAKLIAWPDSVLQSINYVTTAILVMAAASVFRAIASIVQALRKQ